MPTHDVLLVGSGPMAVDYWRVLNALSARVDVIGRSDASAATFAAATGATARAGGLERFLADGGRVPEHAIVAVGIEQLASVAGALIDHGAKRILLEKPGALTGSELSSLAAAADAKGARIFIAYNRRFHASTLAAQALIDQEGGARSVAFEFTEWSHVIAGLPKADGVKERWLIGNSTHVIDLAFFLGGAPTEFSSFTAGALDWHPASAVFAGAGRTDRGALFTYQANWASAGRWGVEVMLPSQRLILRPLETLQAIPLGKVAAVEVPINDAFDKAFKPGLYRQTKAFLSADAAGLCSITEQVARWPVYNRIAGYPTDA
ncbi:hypothetical protein ASG29_14305 [Sphingomonas sp. Leaf412]|nr:hypothetical protein ASG29_14305 [Sphingomonas sp. Leaf412]